MKPEPIVTWIKDIKPIDVTAICEKIEQESMNEMGGFSFYWDKIEQLANTMLEELDFHNLDMVHRHGNPVFHWCGAFTLEPWQELNEEEEEIMNWVNQDFLRVVQENDRVLIKFIWSSQGRSKLYRFFLKEYKDGYSNRTGFGGNIVASLNDALSFATKWCEVYISKWAEKYGEYYEDEPYEDEEDEDCGEDCEGTEGQDRENYTDDQDRESYAVNI